MENFTALAMKFATSDPTRPLTAARKALIKKRLRDFFPNFHTPNHPTYAAMIHRAIMELKEEEGSTEESISVFIRKEFHDLPWAHFTFLKHHLQQLCESGEMVVTSDKCYLLADGITTLNPGPCSSPEREPMQRMRKQQGKKLRVQARQHTKDQNKEQNQPEGEQMEVIQGPNQVQEQRNLAIEKHNLEPPEQCKLERPNSERFSEVKTMREGEVDEFSHTLQHLLEEQRQLR